jgi:hypothetical protein
MVASRVLEDVYTPEALLPLGRSGFLYLTRWIEIRSVTTYIVSKTGYLRPLADAASAVGKKA